MDWEVEEIDIGNGQQRRSDEPLAKSCRRCEARQWEEQCMRPVGGTESNKHVLTKCADRKEWNYQPSHIVKGHELETDGSSTRQKQKTSSIQDHPNNVSGCKLTTLPLVDGVCHSLR